MPTQPKAEVTAEPPPLSEPVAESAPPPKGELLKIVSGYLYMALGELKYERKDIMPIMQRIEKYMNASDYQTALTAYENAESEFLAMLEGADIVQTAAPVPTSCEIDGIEIPASMHDYRVEQLVYISNISKGKTAKSLQNKGITHIRDFFKPENSDLSKILSVKGKQSFIEALKRTVAAAPTAPTETATAVSPPAPEIPKREVYEINGVVIPESKLNKRVDSLKFPNKVSRTKLTKRFKEHGIVRLSDFFREGTLPLYKMISQGGKLSFLAALKESVG